MERKRSINRKKVLDFHQEGVGVTHIAKQISIGRSTVYKLLKESREGVNLSSHSSQHTFSPHWASNPDPKAISSEVAKRLRITTATLYTYVNGDGSLKEAGTKLLHTSQRAFTDESPWYPSIPCKDQRFQQELSATEAWLRDDSFILSREAVGIATFYITCQD